MKFIKENLDNTMGYTHNNNKIKLNSLKDQKEFTKVNNIGIKYFSKYFTLVYAHKFAHIIHNYNNTTQTSSYCYLGFKVSSRIGSAVTRNKIKRRVKAIIRTLLNSEYKELLQDSGIIFISKSRINEIGFQILREELNNALEFITHKSNKNTK